MSKKRIIIKQPKNFRDIEKKIDAWVSGDNDQLQNSKVVDEKIILDDKKIIEDEESYRFTIVIPKYLHIRIKKYCAIHTKNMKNVITEILLKSFPET